MGMTERLKVIVEAQTKGAGSIRSLRGNFDDLDKSATKAKGGIGNMLPGIAAAGVAFGGMAVAARGAWSALEGGAALLETQGKFDRLAESIGTTGDALRDDLGAGIGLLMTQSEQINAATDLMSLGLAKTSDEAVRLATVAGELDMDLGQLALTMTNKTTMRFDQMNMRVDGFAEKVKKLEAAGKSADEAFKWAFIQQAEEQVELVGRKSETAAGQLDMLKNATTQAWEVFQTEFARAVVSQFSDIEGSAERLAEDLAAVAGLLANVINFGGDFVNFYSGNISKRALLFGAEASQLTTGYTDRELRGIYQMQSRNANRGDGGRRSSVSNVTFTPDIRARRLEQREMREEGLKYIEDLELTNYALKDVEEAGVSAFGGIRSSVDEAAQAMQNLSAESGGIFQRLRGQDEFNLAEEIFKMGGQSASGLAEFGVASGLFDQARANELMNQTFLLQSAQQLLASRVGGADLWNAIQGMQGQMGEGSTLAQDFFANLDATVQPTLDTELMTAETLAWAAVMSQTLTLQANVVLQPIEDAVGEAIDAGAIG